MKELDQISEVFESLNKNKTVIKGKDKLSEMLFDLATLIKETEIEVNIEEKEEILPDCSKYIGKIAGKVYIKGGDNCIMNLGKGDFSYYKTPPIGSNSIAFEKIKFDDLKVGDIFIDIDEDNKYTVGLIINPVNKGLHFVYFKNKKIFTGELLGDNKENNLYKIM